MCIKLITLFIINNEKKFFNLHKNKTNRAFRKVSLFNKCKLMSEKQRTFNIYTCVEYLTFVTSILFLK